MSPADQDSITLAIRKMLDKKPRRKQLACDDKFLRLASVPHKDSSLGFPFPETLWRAFNTMCGVRSIGLKGDDEKGYYTYLPGADRNALEKVRRWQETVGQYVAIRDCLALSFALDYTFEGGDPAQSKTRIGALRYRAKPYDGSPTQDTFLAAEQLVEECLAFLRSLSCYEAADAVIAMPPSTPDKPFDLPRHLARGISKRWKRNDLSEYVATVGSHPPLKDLPVEEKLAALRGTIGIEGGPLGGRTVLLVDDLYQSGISMNYVAMELLAAGAREVFGLACEKTCRNDDNVSRSDG